MHVDLPKKKGFKFVKKVISQSTQIELYIHLTIGTDSNMAKLIMIAHLLH